MKRTDNVIDKGKGGSDKGVQAPEPTQSGWSRIKAWYKENGDTTLGRFIKFFISLGVAWFVSALVYFIWFDQYVVFVNPTHDFFFKTAIIFIVASALLVVLDSALKSEGRTTALALAFFLLVNVTSHLSRNYYDADGKPKVFVNHKNGFIYFRSDVEKFTEIKENKKGMEFFIHPITADTCWRDSLKKATIVKRSDDLEESVSDYKSPIGEVIYSVENSPYTFNLKAGEIIDAWITFPPGRIHCNITSNDEKKDYKVIFSENEQYPGSAENMPDRKHFRFFLKGGETDQTITITLNYY